MESRELSAISHQQDRGHALRPGGVPADPAGRAEALRLRQAARDFESIFLTYMLKTTRNSFPQGGIFPSTTGQKIYQELMDEELAKAVSRGGGVGLADVLIRELTRRGLGPRKSSSPGSTRPIIQDDGPGSSEGDLP